MNLSASLPVLLLALFGLSLLVEHPTLTTMLLVNGAAQMVLFLLVACLPFWRTGRMSYVDIAWPFGVAMIGMTILLLGDGDLLRRLIAGAVYLFIGLRMGIAAVIMGRTTGVIFKYEFPRYEYRREMLSREGTAHVRLHMLSEILTQGFANMSVLALPGFLLAINSDPQLSGWEVAGIVLWLIAYLLESVADTQKLLFVSRTKDKLAVCDIGLWRYSRHPNYFAEWLVWTAIVVAALPSWWALEQTQDLFVWSVLGVGMASASAIMFTTLVFLTGARPAEYFSAKKRPGYRAYQARTSMFFPWFPTTSTD